MLGGIILAAGASSRMGRPKALLPGPDGASFHARLAGTLAAAGIGPLVVVAGRHAGQIALAVRRDALPLEVVVNARPERGQLSSLLAGLEVLVGRGCEAVAVAPVDQPLVSVETVRTLAAAWRASRAAVVRPACLGRHGHPAILDARLFGELRAAALEAGARPVIERHAAEVLDVAVDDPGAFEDIDTPEDYRRLVGRPLAGR